MCCGAGGGLLNLEPETSNAMAQAICASKPDKDDVITTSCPTCYSHLLKNSDGKVRYITDFIAEAMR